MTTVWEKVLRSRDIQRLKPIDYIDTLLTDRFELRGDRLFGDDPSILGGIGRFDGQPVTYLGFAKAHTPEGNIHANFGMANPEGYRKAMRLIDQAVKFGRPVLTFIDTPGAYPGIDAEARGQGEAIAALIAKLMTAPVPVLATVTGEGGSGGALCLSIADQILMLEDAVYAILSPEGFSAILWKDKRRAEEAAALMRITAHDLKGFGIVDTVIPESIDAPEDTIEAVRTALLTALEPLCNEHPQTLAHQRMARYRHLGGTSWD